MTRTNRNKKRERELKPKKAYSQQVQPGAQIEDHQNVWIFQRCLHSCIVMSEGGAQQGVHNSYKVLCEVVQENEFDLSRREQLQKEIEVFMGSGGSANNGFPASSLDQRSRERFQPLFQHLKQFLYDFSTAK